MAKKQGLGWISLPCYKTSPGLLKDFPPAIVRNEFLQQLWFGPYENNDKKKIKLLYILKIFLKLVDIILYGCELGINWQLKYSAFASHDSLQDLHKRFVVDMVQIYFNT